MLGDLGGSRGSGERGKASPFPACSKHASARAFPLLHQRPASAKGKAGDAWPPEWSGAGLERDLGDGLGHGGRVDGRATVRAVRTMGQSRGEPRPTGFSLWAGLGDGLGQGGRVEMFVMHLWLSGSRGEPRPTGMAMRALVGNRWGWLVFGESWGASGGSIWAKMKALGAFC